MLIITGIAGKKMSFETLAGIITAEVNDDSVKVKLTDPSPLKIAQKIMLDGRECILDCIDTGVPHAVSFVDDVETCDVVGTGGKSAVMNSSSPRAPTPILPVCWTIRK